MADEIRILTVGVENVDAERFFCYKSKPKTDSYRLKLAWLKERFKEGLRIKTLYEGKRSVAFIEYMPGDLGWRAVKADGYMLVHCLWVVGKGQGQGHASKLLQECLRDAQDQGLDGVAMVTSSDHWLVDGAVLLRNGFERADEAPPAFGLLVKRFNEAPLPSFPQDWAVRRARYEKGLTVVRTDQCPYVEMVTEGLLATAQDMGVAGRVTTLNSAEQVQAEAPLAYGVINVVCDGELVTYHWLGDQHLRARLEKWAT